MTVDVEWVDGEHRTYTDVEDTSVGTEVLRLYGYVIGGRREVIANLPLFHVREWKVSGR
jgi:hypothetical protein